MTPDKYEPDDGPLTEEQLAQIAKLVPQNKFSDFGHDLFSEEGQKQYFKNRQAEALKAKALRAHLIKCGKIDVSDDNEESDNYYDDYENYRDTNQ